MRLRTETDNGTLVVQPEGRIDGAAAIDFRRSMEAVIGDDCDNVLVDCKSIRGISSAGLSAFLMISRTLSSQGINFALFSLPPRMRGVFSMTGFDKIIPVHPSRAEALALTRD